MIKLLKFLARAKRQHFLSVSKEQWDKYSILIRLVMYLNPNYKSCIIFRKRYKALRNIVVVGLKWSGRNVKRRTTGYAKEYLKKHKNKKAVCLYCNDKVHNDNATTDHIVPISKGGNNCQVNLIVCCFDCNNERGDMDFIKYLKLKNSDYSKILFI